MSGTALAVAASVGAALFFALTSVLQHRAATQVRPQAALRPRLLVDLVHQPLWVLGVVTDLAGFGLQVLALGAGPVSLVQPLLVFGLPLAVVLDAAVIGRSVRAAEVYGTALSAAGLAVFLFVADPSSGPDRPGFSVSVAWGATATATTAVCLGYARRRGGNRAAVALAFATGVLYGLTAALVRVVLRGAAGSLSAAVTSWPLYALVVVGGVGYLLNQNAFQAGDLPAPLATLTVVDPVVAIAVGASALGEGIATGGAASLAEAAALGAMAGGVVLLARAAGERMRPHPRPGARDEPEAAASGGS